MSEIKNFKQFKTYEEYSTLKNYLNDIESKVDNAMQSNNDVIDLERKINENNHTFFDPKTDPRFNSFFASIAGEKIFDQKEYDEYKDDIENFDKNIEQLYIERKRISKKIFMSNKKKKLDEIDKTIALKQLKHLVNLDTYKDEMNSNKLWYKDGKFVDINKDYKERLEEIKTNYLKESIKKFFNENPKYANIDYSEFELSENMLNSIKDLQNKSKEKTTNFQNNFKDNGYFKDNKNEFGNDDGGAGSASVMVEENDEDKEKGNGGNAPSSNSQSILTEDSKEDKKKSNEEHEREM